MILTAVAVVVVVTLTIMTSASLVKVTAVELRLSWLAADKLKS